MKRAGAVVRGIHGILTNVGVVAIAAVALGGVFLLSLSVIAYFRGETGDGLAAAFIRQAREHDGLVVLRTEAYRYCLLGEENLVHVGRSFEGSTVRWLESRETDGVWFLFRQHAEDPGDADVFTVHQDALHWDAYGAGPARARFCPETLRIETIEGRETIVWFNGTTSPSLAPAEE